MPEVSARCLALSLSTLLFVFFEIGSVTEPGIL